jgi:hypothetical protein
VTLQRLVSNLTLVISLIFQIWSEIPAVVHLLCFWVTLVRITHRKMQICLASTSKVFKWGTIHRRISSWTMDSSTDPTWGENCGAVHFGFGHAKGPWSRRDISTASEKDCAGCKETAWCCFFYLSLLSGVFPSSHTLSLCSRVVTRKIFRTIVEYLFYRRFLSFLKS